VARGVKVLIGVLVAFAERSSSQSEGQQNHSAHKGRGIQFVISLYGSLLSS
jgi:hypothetical protein